VAASAGDPGAVGLGIRNRSCVIDRILITGAPVDRSYAERLVDAVLDDALPGAMTPKE